MVSKRVSLAILAAVAIGLTGCAESTRVRSLPTGSKVYVNDIFVGLTPLAYSVPHDQIHQEFNVRVEHPGYETAYGTLKKDVCRGRIVGGVFTLGILLLIKGGPTCFAGVQDFALTELSAPHAAAPEGPPSVETRLQRLETMREQGTISDEEFDRLRAAILEDL